MADKEKVEIDVTVKGDAKGAKDIAKGLERIEKSADKANKKIGGNGGLNKSVGEMFPTFKKGGAAVKGLVENIFGAINPVGLATAGITAFIGLVIKSLKDWEAQNQATLDEAAKKFETVTGVLQKATDAQSKLAAETTKAGAAMSANLSALTETEQLIKEGVSDNARLAESIKQVTIARINQQIASGEISEEAGAQKIATLELTDAEEDFARKTKAANEILKARLIAQKENQELAKQQAERAEKAEADVEQFESGFRGNRERAADFDPILNQDVQAARKIEQGLLAELRKIESVLSTNRLPDGSTTDENGENVAFFKPKFRQRREEILGGELSESRAGVEAAETARDKKVQAELDRRRKEAELARRGQEQSEQLLQQSKERTSRASLEVQQRRDGGIERQIFENQQEVRRSTAPQNAPTQNRSGGSQGNVTLAPIPVDRVEQVLRDVKGEVLRFEKDTREKIASLEKEANDFRAQLAKARVPTKR